MDDIPRIHHVPGRHPNSADGANPTTLFAVMRRSVSSARRNLPAVIDEETIRRHPADAQAKADRDDAEIPRFAEKMPQAGLVAFYCHPAKFVSMAEAMLL